MILALALSLLLQESPEDVFRKIEAKIEKAEKLLVDFSITSPLEKTNSGTGTFKLDRGNRYSISAQFPEGRRRITLEVGCDGEKIRSTLAGNLVESGFDPRFGRGNLLAGYTHFGIFMNAVIAHGMMLRGAGDRGFSVDLRQMISIVNLKAGADEPNGGKTLTYDFKSAIEPMPIRRARIWYDPKTYLLLKREQDITHQGQDLTLIENYDHFEIDGVKPESAPQPVATPKAPEPPISDELRAGFFIKAKLRVASEQLRDGKKEKAAETLEEVIAAYPQHPLIGDARKMLIEAGKK